jgi:predicted ferric reductase
MSTQTVQGPAPAATRTSRPLHRQTLSQLLLVLVVLGAAAVVGLWWTNTRSINGFGDWLTNAGRLTGLLAGYAVVVQLLLMARVPALERGIGSDQLARWHSYGGRYTVSLIVSHALLIIWGYAVVAHTSVVHETGALLTSYPDVLMATVALGLFVMIGVVSARAARRRMKYETWYYLHFYAYLAIALAFSHQFANGAEFMSSLPARMFWASLYLLLAGLLLWFRVFGPVRFNLRHRMRVWAVRQEVPGVWSVLVTGRRMEELSVEPGQFFRWRFLTRNGWWQSHPYSLSAPPHPSMLRFTVKALGDHSREISQIRAGTRVVAEGPYGALTARRRRRRGVVLVAGGIGVTPLRALFEAIPGGPGEVTLLYRANRMEEVVFRAELEDIARRRGARVHYLVGPPGGPNEPLTAVRLAGLVPGIGDRDVYVCGPPGMTAAARTALRGAGVPRGHIHIEDFSF